MCEVKNGRIKLCEEWKDLVEFPDLYQVSSFGRIRNKLTLKVLSQWRQKPRKRGTHRGCYLRVTLTVNSLPVKRTVHVCVCEAFHGPRPSKEHEACHNDGKYRNCRARNLRWGTRAENLEDKRRHAAAAQQPHSTRPAPEEVQCLVG